MVCVVRMIELDIFKKSQPISLTCNNSNPNRPKQGKGGTESISKPGSIQAQAFCTIWLDSKSFETQDAFSRREIYWPGRRVIVGLE